MAEVDPVILEIRAELGRYKAELRSTTTSVERLLGRQEKSAKRLEAEMRRSSSAIASTLRGLAGTLAAAFTGRELVGLIDGFTRLQNNLRVAGQEGENLARVQSSLLSISQQYGVDVETLSGVFLKASLAQNELGASTEEIIRLNEIVAASLKITGTSAEEARGALLQLGQALGSDVVRGEEFNSLLENALPLVQAAARGIDRFGGSVARLRAEVVDSKVTSQEFFEGVLRGGVQTIEDAEKANLTLAGSFEALRSQLLVYFGEAGKGAGATEALTSAINALADNLDVIIPALATIALALGVKMVGSAVAASSAMFALTAVMGGAATATEGLTFAMAGLTRVLPLAALTAVIGALGYLAVEAHRASGEVAALASEADAAQAEAEAMEKRIKDAGGETDKLGSAAQTARGDMGDLTGAMEGARQKAAELGQQAERTGKQLLQMRLQEVLGQRQQITNSRNSRQRNIASQTRTGDALATSGDATFRARENQELAELQRLEEALRFQIQNYGLDPGPAGVAVRAPTASSDKAKKSAKTRTRSGPDAAEIAARQEAEIARLRAEEIQARLNLTEDIDERANLQAELDAIELAQRRADIESNADLSRAQKDAQLEILNGLFGVSGEIDEQGRIIVRGNEGLYAQIREREAQFEELRRAGQLEADTARAKEDVLRSQLSITSDREERARLERQILDIQIEAAKAELRNQIATLELAKGREKEVALLRQRLSDLDTIRANEAEGIARDNESPLQRYARGLNESDLGDEAEQLIVDEIETVRGGIRDAIADAIGTDDPLITGLLDLLLQDLIFKPLANSLANASGGGGGGFIQVIGGVLGAFAGGRASGGYVSPGTMYRVNEGSSPGRVEGFRPAGSGEIIPLGQMNALANGGMRSAAGGGVAVVRLELSGDIDARIDQRSTNVAVEVTRATAPRLIDAAANETARRFSRPKL
ncbi:MAG: putative tape measure protein [Prokaryotic dsDNA virus sp.]|mgnify:CR=1 FL=1|nr:MAG: putative tape measure protein [Prokaryotic dsDNA virus sp.]